MAVGSWGNTFNTMEGYRYASMVAAGYSKPASGRKPVRLVYLVEEDMFVAADFFTFQRATQAGKVAGLGPAADPEQWAVIHSVEPTFSSQSMPFGVPLAPSSPPARSPTQLPHVRSAQVGAIVDDR